jgi:predicted nucleic acid-binding protein
MAVLNTDDQYHPRATKIWREILAQDIYLISTNYILVETIALLQRRIGMEAVRIFQKNVLPIFDVAWVNEEIHQLAISAFSAASRRNLSLVDCVSFVVMQRRDISLVFTFDPHFQEQGFEVIRPRLAE